MYGLQGWQRLDEEDEGIEQNGQGAETMAHRLNSAGKKMATCNACDGDGIMQVKGAGKKVKRWLARAGKEWLDTMGYWAAQEGTEGWVLH